MMKDLLQDMRPDMKSVLLKVGIGPVVDYALRGFRVIPIQAAEQPA